MKTVDEILARIDSVKAQDIFGTERSDLIDFLPYAQAKQFLKPEITEDQWKPAVLDRDTIISAMREYTPFAWEKANNCRGLSAARSLSHFCAWVWLLGDDPEFMRDYEFYGKDHLVVLCTKYDLPNLDDGIRANSSD